MQGVWLILVLAIAQLSYAATVTFNYDPSSTRTFDWNTGSTWDTGSVPTAQDDVVIQGNDYGSNSIINTLTLSSSTSIQSLTISGPDVKFAISSATLTIGDLTYGDAVMTGTSQGLTKATIVLTGTGAVDAGDQYAVLSGFVFNATATSTMAWSGSVKTPSTTINNNGAWSFIGTTEVDNSSPGNGGQTFVFNNYATLTIETDVVHDNYGDCTITGVLNNYGTLTVTDYLSIAKQSIGGSNTWNTFTTTGPVIVNGQMDINEQATANFKQGSTLTGDGLIYLLGYAQYATLNLNISVNFAGGITLNGWTALVSNYDLHFGNMSFLSGAKISGTSGSITVGDLQTGEATYGGTNGAITSLQGKNLTVTNHFSSGQTIDYHLGKGAFLIFGPNCWGTLDGGYIAFSRLDADTSSIGFLNYGNLTNGDIALYVATLDTLPIYNYGAIGMKYVDSNGIEISGGGVHSGLFWYEEDETVSFETRNLDTADFGFVLGGPLTITNKGMFEGGIIELENADGCTSYTGSGCEAGSKPGLYSFQGRSSSIGNGAILSHQATTISIDGPGVVFERYMAIGGYIQGAYNLTVERMRKVGWGYTDTFYINGISMIITQNISMEDEIMNFANHGKLIINKDAALHLTILDFESTIDNSADAGVYSYGTTYAHLDQYSTTRINTNFWNFGDIRLATTIDTTNHRTPSGAIIEFTGGKFIQSSTGRVYLTAYTAKDADQLNIYTGNACAFSGIIHVTFEYTPVAGDRILISQSQGGDGYTTCTGLWTLETTNLPNNLIATIFYDDTNCNGSSNCLLYHVAVCTSGDTTCTNYQRASKYLGTTSTSGAAQSTTSKSATSSPAQTSTTSASKTTTSTSANQPAAAASSTIGSPAGDGTTGDNVGSATTTVVSLIGLSVAALLCL